MHENRNKSQWVRVWVAVNILFIGLHVKADFVPSVQVYVSLHIFRCVRQVENLLDTNKKARELEMPITVNRDANARMIKKERGII